MADNIGRKFTKKIPDGLDEVGKPYKVLVVEDDNTSRKLLVQMLRSDAYNVCGEAVNGEMAVKMYKDLDPDIVTMDIKMPKMNGFDALKEILKFDTQAIVVMLSSETKKDVVLDSINVGAKNYILKPFDREKVLKKIKEVLPIRAKKIKK